MLKNLRAAAGHKGQVATSTIRIVAVGKSGMTWYSDDNGVSWNSNYVGIGFALNGVAWNGSIFAAVGANDTINGYTMLYTSSDGITWTKRSVSGTYSMSAVVWANSQFVAVGTSGRAYTSPDGITWTVRTTTVTSTLMGIIWDGSQYVCCGVNAGTKAVVQVSTDGITWTDKSYTVGSYGFYSMAFDGTNYVFAGQNIGTDPFIMTTTDLASYTQRFPSLGGAAVGASHEMVYNSVDGEILMVTNAYAASSSDGGATWGQKDTNITSFPAVQYFPDETVYVTGLLTTKPVYTSPDGNAGNWTSRLSSDGTNAMYDLASRPAP